MADPSLMNLHNHDLPLIRKPFARRTPRRNESRDPAGCFDRLELSGKLC
jgi:hypothetical protein